MSGHILSKVICAGLAIICLVCAGSSCICPAERTASATEQAGTLAAVNVFAQLTDAERSILKGAATLQSGKTGERIITQGMAMKRMTVIMTGEADVFINKKKIVTLKGQVLVGEIEFLDGKTATADVILKQDSDLVVLDNARLRAIMDKHPRIGYVLMHEIAKIESQRLRETSTK